MIRVCVVEDHTIVRQGLRTLLDLVDDSEVVAEAFDGGDAIRRIPESAPDVVLLDMRMPRLDGLDVLKQLGEQHSLPPTIILTTFDDDDTVLDGMRAGAKGFLLKDVSLDQLTSAIRTVAGGGTMIQPAVTERILKGLEGIPCEFPSLDPPDTRNRDSSAHGRRLQQPRDRRLAQPRRGHREEPHFEHPLEAWSSGSDAVSAQGSPARVDPAAP